MKTINRRNFLKVVGSAMAALTLGGCSAIDQLRSPPEMRHWPPISPAADWQVLNRITFGPRSEERQHAADIGLAAFIEEQLAPGQLPEMPLWPRLTLRRLESLHLDVPDLFDVEQAVANRELKQATVLRAVYSSRQLYEIMVNFWSDHFNITQTKGDCIWLKTVDDRDVIRPHALGNFQELLFASARSPAMLIYLDNQENRAGNPNENYARELLELHTLSINGGYTQKDIQELARCLTGWTVKQHFYRGQFTFEANQHDNGPKNILGISVPAGAKQTGGEQVLEMLAGHPATARFIATKLARRFVSDSPPPELVNRATQTFLNTRGDIKAVLHTILLSSELLPKAIQPGQSRFLKLKRPFSYIVSALRQLNIQTDGGPAILEYLSQMGQPLFEWSTPDGFPDRAEFWNSSLLTRWRFAIDLVHNNLSDSQLDLERLLNTGQETTLAEKLHQLTILLLGQPLSPVLTEQLLQTSKDERILLAALLGSPAFQWR